MARLGWIVLALLAGCGRGPVFYFDPGECGPDRELCILHSELRRAADVLFVVDNSGSMGEEQGKLARNFPEFAAVLEQAHPGASFRFGITTTDSQGQLQLSSCRERLGHFVFSAPDFGTIDATQTGCLDVCSLDSVPLVATSETAGETPLVRPWLERAGNETNLAPGVSLDEALRCIGPQGIDGSGFEAHLESMLYVIEGFSNSAGFVRDDALFAVVFLTDEQDCSMPLVHQSDMWEPEAKPLWSDPEGDRPTSAVCWNASARCTGEGPVFDDCVAEDRGWDRLPVAPGEEPVLYPVERYVDGLRELADAKSGRGGVGEVLVALIGGVPLDYPQTGELLFALSDDPAFNLEYGVGPACNRGTETISSPPGIPPVRLREFAEAFATEGRNMYSICADEYGSALEGIAEGIGRLSQRTCVDGCVTDVEPELAGLQPACRAFEDSIAGEPREIPACVSLGAQGWDFPSTSLDVCVRTLTDADGSTSQDYDDLSSQCRTRGGNAELVVERAVPVAADVIVSVDCALERPVGVGCDEEIDPD